MSDECQAMNAFQNLRLARTLYELISTSNWNSLADTIKLFGSIVSMWGCYK